MALFHDFCLISLEKRDARAANDCLSKAGWALVGILRHREHKECGSCLLIYGGGEVAAKTSEWLQGLGAGSSPYALICGGQGQYLG